MPSLPLRGEAACPYSYASAIPVSLFLTVRFPQLLIHVGILPRGNDSCYTAEMTVGGCLLVDGTAQVKMLDDLAGSQTKALLYSLDQLFLICSSESGNGRKSSFVGSGAACGVEPLSFLDSPKKT